MAANHMKVLAEQIYNEQNIVQPALRRANVQVTYRLLSRLAGVHVNLAKQYSLNPKTS
jgi:hypothetical protein